MRVAQPCPDVGERGEVVLIEAIEEQLAKLRMLLTPGLA
jgi:hypothetical protein